MIFEKEDAWIAIVALALVTNSSQIPLSSKLSKQDDEGQIKFPWEKTKLTDTIPNIKNVAFVYFGRPLHKTLQNYKTTKLFKNSKFSKIHQNQPC